MYIQWDFENKTHIGVPSNVPGEVGNWIRCTPPSTPRKSPTQTLKWLYLEGIHENYLSGYWEGSDDPLDELATKEQITQARDRVEEFPILTSFGLMDADQAKSEKRMRGAIESWDLLAIPQINWIRADNTEVLLTKENLLQVLDEVLSKRAIRALVIHSQARAMKQGGTVTQKELLNWENAYRNGETHNE